MFSVRLILTNEHHLPAITFVPCVCYTGDHSETDIDECALSPCYYTCSLCDDIDTDIDECASSRCYYVCSL